MIWSKHVLYPDKGHGLTLTYLDSAVFPEPNQTNKRRVSTCSFFFLLPWIDIDLINMKHVKFLPWVGDRYQIGWNGRRIMVLGESHYCPSSEEAVPQITNRVMADLLDTNSEHEGYKNTFTKFANALMGKSLSFDEKKAFWHSVLFYNYVQIPLPAARLAPSEEDFAKSETAFFEVLDTYQPDYIIVWGKRLYNHLPRQGYQLPDLILPDGDGIETWAYKTSAGRVVQVLSVTHPSAGFASDYWYEAMQAFIGRTL